MKLKFFGGPWDGEEHEVAEGTNEIRVPLPHSQPYSVMTSMAFAPSMRVGTYKLNFITFRMEWQNV